MARNTNKAPSTRPTTAPPRELTRCSPGSFSTRSKARIANFSSTIKIKKDGKEGNAKSIISVLSLGASNGSEITISCTGEDEQEALNALIDLLDNLEE